MTSTLTTPVPACMAPTVATIDHEATLQEAAEALAASEIGVVVVLGPHAPVGILSERDIVAHVAVGTDLSHLRVGEAMTDDMVTIGAEADLGTAITAMATAGVRHLPVIREDRMVGMISARDVLDVLARVTPPSGP